MSTAKWDNRFLALAEHVASWSKDPSTKVGAVIARHKTELAMGYNGFPTRIVDTDEWLNDRPTKYRYVIHAEMNAILKAGKEGRNIEGATLYLWPLPPCAECAKMILAAGITRVIVKLGDKSTGKYQDFSETEEILRSGGVDYEWH